jgi:hypothetical protein
MEPVLDIDFSEIINEEDDSWAFVDFNILESARQELEEQKKQQIQVEKRVEKQSLWQIKEHHEEQKITDERKKGSIVIEHWEPISPEPFELKKCHHSSIQPVFDWIYCARTNIVVDKLIHKNLAYKYRDSDIISFELSMVGKKIENNLITTTLANQMHSTAVSNLNGRSSSLQKGADDGWKFYSLSNSMAKIKLEKQNTFNSKSFCNH